MKIYILLPNLGFGGGERISLNLANEFKKDNHEVVFCLLNKEGELTKSVEKKFKIIDLKCNVKMLIFYLLKNLYYERPNILISNYFPLNISSCLLKIFYPKLKIFCCEHSPPSFTPFININKYKLFASFFYIFSNKIIAVSNGVKKNIIENTWFLKKKVITIYNPIVDKGYRKINLKKNKKNSIRLVFVGKLKSQKNIYNLLDAFKLLQNDLNCTLWIVGSGEILNELIKYSKKINVYHKIWFLGYNKNISKIISHCDIFVLSSDYEGLPTVLIEALYTGIKIVSTDCPYGPREILLNGKIGSLSQTNNSLELCNAIKREINIKRNPQDSILRAMDFSPKKISSIYLSLMK